MGSGVYDSIAIVRAMRIGLIAIDGCFGSAVASIIDIVRVADGARGDVDPRIDPIELAILGPKRRVTTTASMTLSVDHPLSESAEFDVVVVPALGTLTDADAVALARLGASVYGSGASTTRPPGSPRRAPACSPSPRLDGCIIGGRRPAGSWGRSS